MRGRQAKKRPSPLVAAVVGGNTAFALDLYDRLRRKPGNLFISPYSISTALAMTYGGARGNTEAQMSEVLHFPFGQDRVRGAFAGLAARARAVQDRGRIQLAVANSLWPDRRYPPLAEYSSLTRENYGVTIIPVDYARAHEAARRKINAWVEKRTLPVSSIFLR